jgi:hypothetical protein
MSFNSPLWSKPAPLGHGQAIDSVSGIAAPLLAGFAIATSGVIAQASDRFRWPGVALLALTIAAVLLVLAVQCGFRCRQFLYSSADVAQWWPDADNATGREARLRKQQHDDFARWESWERGARLTYNAGIVAFAVGLASALAPMGDTGIQGSFRWVAAGIATASAIGEAIWSFWKRSTPNASQEPTAAAHPAPSAGPQQLDQPVPTAHTAVEAAQSAANAGAASSQSGQV